MDFSNKLKELRMERNLTQEQMAELIEVHPRTYKRYENGKTTPNIQTLRKIVIALGTSCDELLGIK